MRPLRLKVEEQRDGVTVLGCVTPIAGTHELSYHTRTGALLRIDGVSCGAFDREHATARIGTVRAGATFSLEVENESLPTSGLPSGPGLQWWWLNVRKAQKPSAQLGIEPATSVEPFVAPENAWPVVGHAHLDVAWLWTYAEAARKAMRTFAIAQNLAQAYPEFVFTQSQPQLYAFVAEQDPEFFERIGALVRAGRIDASAAALWVESDCNLPGGESLLRQMLYAHEFCTRHFGVVPSVAWLPDSFGFCNTLPTLLMHAGIEFFATTKLQWNDTTPFPYKQFRWRAPDGSEVTAALMASYEGDVSEARLAGARERNEPLIAGFGDGGGGVTPEMIAQARERGRWTGPESWMRELAARKASLPVHADELYLQYHRGVYTTHHDIKARNAAMERKLAAVEEAVAWCVAVRAPKEMTALFRAQLDDAWRVVLRNQFHDVLPGTSIAPVYADVREEYDAVENVLEAIAAGTRNVLPRGRVAARGSGRCEPSPVDGGFVFDNGLLRAYVNASGVVTELTPPDGRNAVAAANVLLLYADRPKKWEAWNIDAGYARRMKKPKAGPSSVRDGALCIPFSFGPSSFEMRVFMLANEPFLRVELDCDWQSRRTLLRVEHWLTLRSDEAVFGTPHGTIVRSALDDTPERRAQFEVPGQRFGVVREAGSGFVQFALDTYGWNARVLPKGGMHLGHSLLRAAQWPDPDADRGRHTIRYALAAFAQANNGTLENIWNRFALEPRVRLFSSESDAVAVVACKPALDGDGVILRIRECDGRPAQARIRSGGRVRSIEACNALEHTVKDETQILEGETIVAPLGAYALRSFRVRFA